jgi:serine/threonine protein kinase
MPIFHAPLFTIAALSERHRGDFNDPVTQQQRDVLIKILKNAANDDNQRRLFFIEAQVLVQLKHPNVVTLFGIVTTGALVSLKHLD